MANLTSEQAKQLSDNFFVLSTALLDFRVANWDSLSKEDHQILSDARSKSLEFGEQILALATSLIMNEVAESLDTIHQVTSDIKGTIKNLKNIQKGLNIAAAILVLGIAVLEKDPGKIGESIKGMVGAWGEG